MKLGNFKRIISTDFAEEDQSMIEQLGRQLNDGIDQVYFALNSKLTFDDNFAATVKEVEVTAASNGNPTTRTSIQLNNTNVVSGIIVISATNKSSSGVYPTGTPFISFTQSGNLLYIDNITNLQANNRYLIKIVCLN